MALFLSLKFLIRDLSTEDERNGDEKLTYRLSNSMPNESRLTDEKLEGKKKYFFVVEGEKTESIYLQENAENLKQDALIEILILERNKGTKTKQYIIT